MGVVIVVMVRLFFFVFNGLVCFFCVILCWFTSLWFICFVCSFFSTDYFLSCLFFLHLANSQYLCTLEI